MKYILMFALAYSANAFAAAPAVPEFTEVIGYTELMSLPPYKQEIYLKGLASLMADVSQAFPSDEMIFDAYARQEMAPDRSLFTQLFFLPEAQAQQEYFYQNEAEPPPADVTPTPNAPSSAHAAPQMGSSLNVGTSAPPSAINAAPAKSAFDNSALGKDLSAAAKTGCDGVNQSQAINTFRSGKSVQSSCIYAGNIGHYSSSGASAHCQPPAQICFSKSAPCLKCASSKQVICNPMVFGAKSETSPNCVAKGANATKSCAQAKGGMTAAEFMSKEIQGAPETWNEFANQFNSTCSPASSSGRAHCAECYFMSQRLAKLNGAVGGKGATNYFDTNSGKALEPGASH